MIELKRARQNFTLSSRVRSSVFLKREREPGLIEFSAGIFLDLHAKRGDDVEGGVKTRRFLKHAHHPPVIFHGVKRVHGST